MGTARILAFVIASFALAGCAYWFDKGKHSESSPTAAKAESATSSPKEKEKPEPSAPGDVVRLKGSTTVGADLAPKLAAAFLASLGATDVTTREGAKTENRVKVSGTVKGRPVVFDIEYPGSGAAFDCLRGGACDVGMSSRPIQQEEVDKLKDLGDMTSPACEHVLAMDGIAVVVHRSNRLSKLTVAQVGSIFLGEVKSWDKVGGPPKDIHVVTRDKNSGTYDTFVQFALRGRDVMAGAKVVDDAEAIAAAVAKDDLAIGFVGLPYVGETKALALQDGDTVAAIPPSSLTVGTEDYAFARRLFFYTGEKPTSAIAGQFVEYALSDTGQGVVPQTGFVSLNVRAASSPTLADAPEAYAKATTGAQRLSFNFRFKGSTAKLDPRSVKDLERLARFVKVTSSNARGVSLLGFSDDQGSEPKNLEISRQRAQTIAEQLKGRGVEPQLVDGFGSVLPLAPSDTAKNRQRNRRVEVWLR